AASVDIPADRSTRVFQVPEPEGLSGVYFLRLTLQDAAGKPVSRNFYWLSRQPDVSDWAASNGRYTPIKSYADLTGLQALPAVRVKVSSRSEQRGEEQVERVTVENPTAQLAFSVRLRLMKGKGEDEVVPVLWEDNYFELMPGEGREIAATYRRKQLGGARPYVAVDGWNVAPARE